MSEMEPAELLKDLSERLEQVSSVLNPAKLEAEVSELEQQAAEPGLWDDQEKAQKITSSLSHKKLTLSRLSDLASGVDDARVLLELSSQEADAGALAEAAGELASLGDLLAGLETETLLSARAVPTEVRVSRRSVSAAGTVITGTAAAWPP